MTENWFSENNFALTKVIHYFSLTLNLTLILGKDIEKLERIHNKLDDWNSSAILAGWVIYFTFISRFLIY